MSTRAPDLAPVGVVADWEVDTSSQMPKMCCSED